MDKDNSSVLCNLVDIKTVKLKNKDEIFKVFIKYKKDNPKYKKLILYDMVAKQAKLSPRTVRRIITSRKKLVLMG